MKIGHVEVENGILLAPMEDVTDPPFRRICHRLGADIVYTEFISSEGLVRDARKSLQKLTIYEDERPVSIQIFGSREEAMAESARRAEEAGPDFIDINCGCWVKDVVKRNAGAGLLRDLPLMRQVIKSVVDNTSLPVTVKTRLGWDRQSIAIVEVAKMVEDVGAQALAIHCRTRDQGHEGIASWEYIEQVKAVIDIPVILNGDVRTPEDVKRGFETGADAVMIGRAAIGNPWLFREAHHYLKTGEHLPRPDAAERVAVALDHVRHNLEYKGERYGILEFRKFWGGYLRGLPLASHVRRDLVTAVDLPAIEERLMRYIDEVAAHELEQAERRDEFARAGVAVDEGLHPGDWGLA